MFADGFIGLEGAEEIGFLRTLVPQASQVCFDLFVTDNNLIFPGKSMQFHCQLRCVGHINDEDAEKQTDKEGKGQILRQLDQ